MIGRKLPNKTRTILTLLLSILLSSCSLDNENGAPNSIALEHSLQKGSQCASSQAEFDLVEDSDLFAPSKKVLVTEVANGIEISGFVENPIPRGSTNGAHLKIIEEKKFSGKEIVVTFFAKGTGTLQAVYSTADVGNSGWKTFLLENEVKEFSFNYSVPTINNGNSDYIGVIPVGGKATISAVCVEIID